MNFHFRHDIMLSSASGRAGKGGRALEIRWIFEHAQLADKRLNNKLRWALNCLERTRLLPEKSLFFITFEDALKINPHI